MERFLDSGSLRGEIDKHWSFRILKSLVIHESRGVPEIPLKHSWQNYPFMVTVNGSEYPEVNPGKSASFALALTW